MIPEVLAYSAPTQGFIPLLHQRKRWLSGGRELPFYWWIFFAVFALFYFIVPVAFILHPLWVALFWPLKWVLQTLQVTRIYRCVGEKTPSLFLNLAYEAYLFLVTLSSALFFVMPAKTIWKGRKYQSLSYQYSSTYHLSYDLSNTFLPFNRFGQSKLRISILS